MKKACVWLALGFLLALVMAGCEAPPGEDVSKGDKTLAPEGEDTAEIEKRNAYIDLNNELISRFFTVLSDYAAQFGWTSEFYVEEEFGGFTMPQTAVSALLDKALSYADKMPATGPDAALLALSAPLKEYCDTLAAAGAYYASKGYLGDHFQKARSYHAVIVGRYDEVAELINVFLREVETMLAGS